MSIKSLDDMWLASLSARERHAVLMHRLGGYQVWPVVAARLPSPEPEPGPASPDAQPGESGERDD